MANAPTTLMILGASGDLTRRLLLPGLGTLLKAEPDRPVKVVGVDRVELSVDDWKAKVHDSLAEAGLDQHRADAVLSDTIYYQADLLDEGQVRELMHNQEGDLVVYFALPPSVTIKVCALLESVGVPEGTRLALEKPFGESLETAQALNAQLTQVVPEDHIFRIDHFLGINTILNLVGVRFANRLLQPVWGRDHIEKVEILYDESLALEGRAGYYDHAGAMMDMLQSHLLEVLAFFAMEPPATMDAEEVRSLKWQVLHATHLWGDDVTTATRRARYTAGVIDGKEIVNYVDEPGVDPSRNTETLAEIVVEIANARWAGVPFILRSGKALGAPGKKVVVTFRAPAHVPVGLHDHDEKDQLILDLKPGAVTLSMSMNAEGDPFDLEAKELTAVLGAARMLPYGEILGAILDGDPLLTIRGDEAEQLWRIAEPILDAWRANQVPLQEYAAGTHGPEGWGNAPGWS